MWQVYDKYNVSHLSLSTFGVTSNRTKSIILSWGHFFQHDSRECTFSLLYSTCSRVAVFVSRCIRDFWAAPVIVIVTPTRCCVARVLQSLFSTFHSSLESAYLNIRPVCNIFINCSIMNVLWTVFGLWAWVERQQQICAYFPLNAAPHVSALYPCRPKYQVPTLYSQQPAANTHITLIKCAHDFRVCCELCVLNSVYFSRVASRSHGSSIVPVHTTHYYYCSRQYFAVLFSVFRRV